MESIIKLIEITIWPITVLIILLSFKKSLSNVITRLSSVKYDKLSAEFSESIQSIEDKAKELDIPSEETKKVRTLEERLLQINEISPKAAVFDAWSEIEAVAHQLGFAAGTTIKKINYANLFSFLEEKIGLKKEEINIINDLRIARNRAAHLSDHSITIYDGLKYIKTAVKVVEMMQVYDSIDFF